MVSNLQHLKGKNVLAFIDNVSVVAALVSSASSRWDIRLIVTTFRAWLIANQIFVYWEYINTDANPSDIISREFKYKDDLPMDPMELPWWCQPNTVEERPLLDFLKQCFENAEEGIQKVSSAVPVSV